MPFGSRRSLLRIRARSFRAEKLVSALVVFSQPMRVFVPPKQMHDRRVISSVHVSGDQGLAHRILLVQQPRRLLPRLDVFLRSSVPENVIGRQAMLFGAQADDLTYRQRMHTFTQVRQILFRFHNDGWPVHDIAGLLAGLVLRYPSFDIEIMITQLMLVVHCSSPTQHEVAADARRPVDITAKPDGRTPACTSRHDG